MFPFLKYLRPLLLIFFLSSVLCYGQEPKIIFNKISSEQGLSQGHGITILQDSKGFMWFGTHDGLNKWDGYKMTVYRNDSKDSTSVSNNDIVTLFEDREKNLWVGTINGLNLFDPRTEKFKSFKHNPADSKSISSSSIRSIFEDKEGTFWIGTYEGGLNKFDKKNTFTRIADSKIGSTTITCFYQDRSGVLWIGTENGLRRYEKSSGKFIAYKNNEGDKNTISADFITSLEEDHLGNFWITTQWGGLNLFDRRKESFKHFLHNPNDSKTISNNSLYTVVEDLSGNIWIGSENGGLNLFDRATNSFKRYTNNKYDAKSLSSNTVSALYVDRSGLIWVGMHRGGINFFSTRPEKFSHFKTESHSNSLSNNNIKPLFEDRSGNIWIGTDGGGLNKYNPVNNSFEHFIHDPKNSQSLSANAVLGIVEEDENKLWIGTWDGGLNLLDTKSKKFKHYSHDPKDSTTVSSNNIWTIFKDTKGNIWIGTFGGGLCLYDRHKDKVRRISALKDGSELLTNKNVFAITEDSDGNIWVGTQNGLNRYNPDTGKITHYLSDETNSTSLSSNYINALYTDSKGRLWVGTQKGLNLFNPEDESFRLIGEKEGLATISIQGIVEDNKGDFWISTLKGLAHFNSEKKLFKLYTAADGLQGNEFSQSSNIKLRNGAIVFGGLNGFNIFHPERLKNNPEIPPVYLTDFQIFNKPVEIGGIDSPLKTHISSTKTIVLSYKQSVFSFEFAALNYLASENNQYAYMLEGFEKEWNFVGQQRKANYTNLDAGEYIFKVKASNNDGIWNEEGTSIKVIITPPFWQTWWFKLSVFTLLVGSIFVWYKVRINEINRQKKILEIKVKIRTAELEKANIELTNQKEEILEQKEEILSQSEKIERLYEELKDSIKAADVVQQSILPSEKIIKQHLHESFILNRPKDVVSGDFYWFDEKDNKLIIGAADCTGHGVSGAFMSINGYHFLKHAVYDLKITDAAEILNRLNQALINENFEEESFTTSTGMDIALCVIDKSNRTIQYAGAKNPLYIVRGKELIQYKANKLSIGGFDFNNKPQIYTNTDIQLQPPDIVYLFSDGYADQLGGEHGNQKFMYPRFRDLLISLGDKSMEEQKLILDSTLNTWKGKEEQTDDILVIGFKI